MSTLTGARAPRPSGDFVAESINVLKDSVDLKLPFPPDVIEQFKVIAPKLKELQPPNHRIAQEVEDEIWTCIGGYWLTGPKSSDPEMCNATRLNAAIWLIDIWFEIIQYGAHHNERRPPNRGDRSR